MIINIRACNYVKKNFFYRKIQEKYLEEEYFLEKIKFYNFNK